MKTPFLSSRSHRGGLLPKGTTLATGIVLVLCAVVLVLRLLFPGSITLLAAPLWSAGTVLSGGIGNLASLFRDRSELAQERTHLLAHVATLTATNAELSTRVDDLTQLLGTRTEPEQRILAGVLARPPLSPYDTLVIDQGSRAGIALQQSVFGPGGVPIGTVQEVSTAQARITLFSAYGRESQGWIGIERIPITLEGRGAGTFTASVPHDAVVTVGAQVYLPGPGAVPVGVVTHIDADPSSPRSVVHVRPSTNIFSLTWVTIAPS